MPKFPCNELEPSILIPPVPLQEETERADEQPHDEALQKDQAERQPMYTPGAWVEIDVFDEKRVPNGYVYEHGRITRVNKRSARPPHVPPEAWQMYTTKQKQYARERYTKILDEARAAEHEAQPPPIAVGAGGTTSARDSRRTKAAPKTIPEMPCCVFSEPTWKHREKIADLYGMRGLATVARPVKAQEVRSNPAAQAAMDKEWAPLRELKDWGEANVREWSDVRNEAKTKKERNHVGMVFGFCVEKGSELPMGNP